MTSHVIDTCPDDFGILGDTLDDITRSGASIVSVLWHPSRIDAEDQATAYEARGSFIIVSRPDAAVSEATLLDADLATA
jgi:hypothetical protein